MPIPVVPDVPPFGGVKSLVMQNAATGTANGTDFNISGFATVVLLVAPDASYTGTVSFKCSPDGTTFTAIQGAKQLDGTIASSVVCSGGTASIWTFQVAGSQSFRASIAGDNTNKVTVTGFVSNEPNLTPLAATITSTVLGAGTNVVGSVMLQTVSGTALAADVTNSELRVSAYGKNSAAGDTPIKVASSGDVIVEGAGTAGTASGGVLTVQGVASMTPVLATGTGTAGSAASGVVTVQGISSMTPVLSKVVDSAGTNQVGVDANHALLITDGGLSVATVTAQTAGAAALKTAAGRICRIIVTSTATAAILLYDNTNAASGTVIGAVPASTAVGTMFSPNIPFTNGIFPAGAVNTPSLTVSYL